MTATWDSLSQVPARTVKEVREHARDKRWEY
jgi:hypothetical protein